MTRLPASALGTPAEEGTLALLAPSPCGARSPENWPWLRPGGGQGKPGWPAGLAACDWSGPPCVSLTSLLCPWRSGGECTGAAGGLHTAQPGPASPRPPSVRPPQLGRGGGQAKRPLRVQWSPGTPDPSGGRASTTESSGPSLKLLILPVNVFTLVLR